VLDLQRCLAQGDGDSPALLLESPRPRAPAACKHGLVRSQLAPSGPPTITVLGTAVLRAEPDEAILWIRLSALEDSPGQALADVADRSERLIALLDASGVPRADRSSTGVRIDEEFDHTKQGRRSLGHRATAVFAVRLSEEELIGQLISRSSMDAAASIDGPHWSISAGHPVRLEAARQAAADARRRAEAYADGAGAKLGPLTGLAEPGTATPTLVRRGKIMPAGGLQPMPVEAGELDVLAVIEASFELQP
jgi:uncharacterized protein